jgi:hypothetical protein
MEVQMSEFPSKTQGFGVIVRVSPLHDLCVPFSCDTGRLVLIVTRESAEQQWRLI